jgi:RsiW-degrading membrane proteinase PrsW (M82 family)
MIILAIILGLLPGFAWLLFYLKEDLHPEPKKLIALVFFAGVASTILALIIQNSILCFFANPCNIDLDVILDQQSPLRGTAIISLFALAEELIKFGIVYFIVRKNSNFNEPVDAMIYMVVVSLGFATVENIAISHRVLGSELALGITTLGDALKIISLRFVGATLLHTLSSAVVGYYWAKSIRDFGQKRFIVMGLIIAAVLHAIFNYLIIEYDFRIYSILLLAVVGFLILADFEKLKKRSI